MNYSVACMCCDKGMAVFKKFAQVRKHELYMHIMIAYYVHVNNGLHIAYMYMYMYIQCMCV